VFLHKTTISSIVQPKVS